MGIECNNELWIRHPHTTAIKIDGVFFRGSDGVHEISDIWYRDPNQGLIKVYPVCEDTTCEGLCGFTDWGKGGST